MKMLQDLTTGIFALMLAVTLSAGQAVAEGDMWIDNFEKAKTEAAKENKLILADFTGSDWCGWCIKLNEEVFSKQEFQNYVKDKFVLLELDFPRQKKQDAAIKKQNEELVQKYGVRGFPTVLVLDAKGDVVEKLGYMPGGPDAFIKELEKTQGKS